MTPWWDNRNPSKCLFLFVRSAILNPNSGRSHPIKTFRINFLIHRHETSMGCLDSSLGALGVHGSIFLLSGQIFQRRGFRSWQASARKVEHFTPSPVPAIMESISPSPSQLMLAYLLPNKQDSSNSSSSTRWISRGFPPSQQRKLLMQKDGRKKKKKKMPQETTEEEVGEVRGSTELSTWPPPSPLPPLTLLYLSPSPPSAGPSVWNPNALSSCCC